MYFVCFPASIPVGIAIGRQRQFDSEHKSAEDLFRGGASACATSKTENFHLGAIRAPPTSSADSSASPASRHAAAPPPPGSHPTAAGPSGPWPPIPPPHHPLWGAGHPPPVPYHPPTHMTPWMPGGVSPAGPIPMGYQLAKDPLTGQLLLIPTDGSPSAPPPSVPSWPPSPYDAATASLLSTFGGHHPLGLTPTAGAARDAQAHYHHMYLQHQQHIQYLQAAAASRELLNVSATISSTVSTTQLTSTLASSQAARKEPETITVSSDDDEVVAEIKKTASPAPLERKVDKSKVPMNSNALPQSHKNNVERRRSSETPPQSIVSTKKELNMEKPIPSVQENQPESKSIKAEPSESLNLSSENPLAPTDDNEPQPMSETDDVESAPESTGAESCIKLEPKDLAAHNAEESKCAEALMALAISTDVSSAPVVSQNDGLDVLLQGIEFKQEQEANEPNAVDFLCLASQKDAVTFGLHKKYLNVDLLCHVTQQEFVYQQNFVDPLILLKQQYNLHRFQSVEREAAVKDFIAAKIRQYAVSKEESHGPLEEGMEVTSREEKYLGLKSLEKVIRQIRNTEIMSQLEVELRAMMVQIQSVYREKQKELAKLKASPKKKLSKGSKRPRGPGRPKKRKLKSFKSKMGRPRKKPPMPTIPSEDEDQEAEPKCSAEMQKPEEEDLSPPVLEPCGPAAFVSQFGRRSSSDSAAKNIPSGPTDVQVTSGLLKPPKLTASFARSPQTTNESKRGEVTQHQNSVTNLSTIHSKFMRGKESPFANLMRLAANPQPSTQGSEKDEGEEDEDEEEEDAISRNDKEDEDEDGTNSDACTSSRDTISSPPLKRPLEGSSRKESDLEDGCGASKRRKSEKPRKHTGITETIVPKKPRHLFMMSLSMQQRGFKVKDPVKKREDQYEFHEEEEEEEEEEDEEEVVEEEEATDEPKDVQPSPKRRSSADKRSLDLQTSRIASLSSKPAASKKKKRRSTSSSSHSGTEVWSTVNPEGNEKVQSILGYIIRPNFCLFRLQIIMNMIITVTPVQHANIYS